jgi:transmembrane protein EpsG
LGLFYGFYSITGIRQTIAVSFIMYAYISLLDKKILLFGLFTFIAYLFHVSAIVFIISVFLVRIKHIKVLIYSVLLFLPILFVFRYEVFSYAVLLTGLEERFLQYMEESYRGSLPVLALYLTVVVGVVTKLGSIPTNSNIGKLIKIFSICILGLPLLFVSGTGIRITQYFSVAMFVLVPYLTSRLKTKANYLLVVLFMFLLIVIAYSDQPYVFYWE